MIELLSVAKVLLCSKAVSAILENLIASAIYDGGKYALSNLFNNGGAEKEYDRKLKFAFYRAVALKTKNKAIKKYIQERDLSKYHDLLIEDLKGNLSENSLKGRYFKDILKEFKAQLRKNPQFGNQIIELYGKECIQQLAEIQNKLNLLIQQQNQAIDILHTLTNQLAANPNAVIREITNTLGSQIESLHIKTAYNSLSTLRTHIKENDKSTLALIDYNRGQCSKYIDSKRAANEFALAYDEMRSSGESIPDIIGGQIYSYVMSDKKEEALALAEELKRLSYSHIWAWVPELIFAPDLEFAYNSLPANIRQNENVIATAIYHIKDFNTFISEVDSYSIQQLNTITLDNIPQWLLHISIAMTRYFREWSENIIFIKDFGEEECKELHKITSAYIGFISKTELPDLSPGIFFINKICEYRSTKNIKLIDEIKTAPYQPNLKLIHHLSYAAIQREVGNYDTAKQFLNEYGEGVDSAIINFQLLLALETSDPDYADSTIQVAVDKSIMILDQHLNFIISCVQYYGSSIGDKVYKIKVENKSQEAIFIEICKHFLGDKVNIELLQAQEDAAIITLKPFIALIYHKNGLTPKGLELIRSCVDESTLDLRTYVYIDLLSSDNAYNVELYKCLNKLRRAGYINNPSLLSMEYRLASKINDYPVMKETSRILYEQNPENGNILSCYMLALSELGETSELPELCVKAKKYVKDDVSANNVHTVLLRAKLYNEAVDFLYTYIKQQDHPSEMICMTFHQSSFIQSTEPIINKEYDEVFDGAFVYYSFNGESRTDIIQAGNRLDCMIGKKVNEEIELSKPLGKDVIIIQKIHNKYYKLIADIYQDIHNGKFEHAFSFTIDDLKGGDGILENMSKIAGNTPESRQRHKQDLENYKNGDLTLCGFIKESDFITGYYNNIFGDFDIYCFPHQDLTELYHTQNYSLESHPIVLDLTSLILLHDISVRFQLDKRLEYIIPRSIKKYITDSISLEEFGHYSHIYQFVADRLAPMDVIEGKSILYAHLTHLLNWIDSNCIVEEVEEKLNVDSKIIDQSTYMSMIYDCVLLAQKRKATLSTEDKALIKQLSRSIPTTCINTIIQNSYSEKYELVCQYLIERHIIGTDISTQYLIDEYDKFIKKVPNSFYVCKQNLAYNPHVFYNTYELCEYLLSRDIITPDSTLLATTLMSDMFKLYNYYSSLDLCRRIIKTTDNQQFKTCARDALNIAHPIII